MWIQCDVVLTWHTPHLVKDLGNAAFNELLSFIFCFMPLPTLQSLLKVHLYLPAGMLLEDSSLGLCGLLSVPPHVLKVVFSIFAWMALWTWFLELIWLLPVQPLPFDAS